MPLFIIILLTVCHSCYIYLNFLNGNAKTCHALENCKFLMHFKKVRISFLKGKLLCRQAVAKYNFGIILQARVTNIHKSG